MEKINKNEQIESAEELYENILEVIEENLVKGISFLKKLTRIYEDTPCEEIAECLSKALFNIILYTLHADEMDQSLLLYADLKTLQKTYADNEEIIWQMSHTSTNMISNLGEWDFESAEDIFEDLYDLFNKNNKNVVLADRTADACYNLMIDLKNSDRKKTYRYLSILKDIQYVFSDYEEITRLYMYASLNYVNFFVSNDKANALVFYKRMKEIAADNPNNEEIVFETVKAASTIIDNFRTDDLQTSLDEFNHLKTLAINNIDDEEIVERTLLVAYNLIVTLKDIDKKQSLEIYKTFKTLADEYDDVESVNQMYALVSLVVEDLPV